MDCFLSVYLKDWNIFQYHLRAFRYFPMTLKNSNIKTLLNFKAEKGSKYERETKPSHTLSFL